jgi:hypothetical protein
MPRVSGRPGASMPPFNFDRLKAELKEKHPYSTDHDVMSAEIGRASCRERVSVRV